MRLVAGWKQRARAIKRDTLALYLACRRGDTPWYAKLVAASVVAYALSPIDVIPDFVPVLGYLDDLVLIPAGMVLAVRLIPAGVMAECRAQAQDMSERPTNRAVAAVIIAVWVLIAFLAIRAMLGTVGVL